MLLGKLTKSEFGKSVLWTGQGVHLDRNTSMKALKEKEKLNFFNSLIFLLKALRVAIMPPLYLLKHG